MTHYDPNIHHRHSIRLKGYDYASAGFYFVTLCAQNRAMMFGEIRNGEMVLNDAGRMVERWYYKTEEKFPDIVCREMVIMPNHFHCIWENTSPVGTTPRDTSTPRVGADPRVRPLNNTPNLIDTSDARVRTLYDNNISIVGESLIEGGHMGPPQRELDASSELEGPPQREPDASSELEGPPQPELDASSELEGLDENTDLGEHSGSPLSAVVQWFKTMSTNEYIRGVKQLGWPPFDRRLWQRNYYERIIRNQLAYNNISNYIINNPARWDEDKFRKS